MIKIISRTVFALVFSSSVLATETVISIESNHTVKETADRFEQILEKKGLTLFARINHTTNAANVNLELAPTEVVIFGNPKVGTLLMQCSKTVAIDLPQKALFWEDIKGQAWLSYNNPEYLKERHNIKGCDLVINKISDLLGKLSKAATSK
ncbi:MAG: hypothetical protein ACJAT7_003463 [Psychromonas sp.]|jgi:uncharacterized protein (DUF302 family)|uniref:DUF302 domain-containing protein n=1 Tax=Psychromonas sp. TaxID=1884585 RepID=UPI0039E71C95